MSQNNRSLRVLVGAVAVLLGANLLVNINQSTSTRTAMAAGIPDSGAQMQAMIDQLRDLNSKVDKLQSFFESGKLSVKVEDAKAKD